MKFSYNNFALDAIGEVGIKQRREFIGGDAPQRAKVIVDLNVGLFERSYGDNYALLQQAKNALAVPNAVLVWTNDDTGETYINQTATLTSEDFPDEWGTYYQELNLSFYYYENLDASSQNLPLTFTVDGGQPLTFDRVTAWADGLTSDRFSSLRSNRRQTTGNVEVEGTILGDTTLPLESRRAALAKQVTALRAAMDSAQGQLTFGEDDQQMFNASVRIASFKADINQAITEIGYKFSATYTLFPDEANYATVEATAAVADNSSGELVLTCTGKISSTSEAIARTKLGIVLATFITQYGFDKGQQLEITATPNLISANADGDTFTELSFNAIYRMWDPANQRATFTATGKSSPIAFGNVKTWEDGYKADYFDKQRSERRDATGTISAAGTFAPPGAMAMTLKDRRAALLALQRRMKQECNNAEGNLVYGDFQQVVRMAEFLARVNQAVTGIDWSFTASYSLFPNEGGYATCEFSADTRDDVDTGDRYLTFTGEIQAPNDSLARAKLAVLRTATLAIYGFTIGQQLKTQNTPRIISANGDATSTVPEGIETEGDVADVSFLRLTFNEEYRQRMPGVVLSSQFTIATRDETTTGLLMTTYAGTVTATGASADAAMATAIARAMVIGANKQLSIDPSAFLKSQSLTIERRQTNPGQPEEFVRLSFSYEYQSKLGAGRAYLEMNTQTLRDSFGPDSDSVSGFIIAKDVATANTIYQQQVRTLYAGRLIRQETLTQSQVQSETPAGASDSLAFITQPLRLEFSFTAHRDKPPGRVTARYSISIRREFRTLKRVCQMRGSIYAFNRAAADTFMSVLTVPFGQLMDSARDEDHDYTPEADVFTKLDFDDVYEDRLTGVSGVIEMRVTESIVYSSTRWAVQAIPLSSNGGGGISIPQAAGITEGSRTVRGSVSAATKATALAWAARHKSMLTGDADGGFYPQPDQIETEYEFAPRVDGIAEDGLAGIGSVNNVQIFKVNFTFSEILPNYLPLV